MRRLAVAGVVQGLAAPAAAHEPDSPTWSPLTGGPRLGVGASDVLRTIPAGSSPGLDVLRAFPHSRAKLRALGRGRPGGPAVLHRAGLVLARQGPVARV